MMKIGLLSAAGNQQSLLLKRQLDQMAPGSAELFELPADAGPYVAIDAAGVHWHDRNLAELDVAYIHGFAYQSPVVPPALGDIDWSVWQTHYLAEQSRYSFLLSSFAELQRQQVRMINPPAMHWQNFMKLDALERLRLAGFDVPTVLCTNDADAARAFAASLQRVVWRPATGRATWQLFTERQCQHLLAQRKPPVLLAEVLEGPLVRAYLFRGQPLLLLQRFPPSQVPVEALETFQRVDYPELADTFARYFAHSGCEWAQLLFTYADGKAWIYDVDLDPVVTWLPAAFRHPLVEALAARLLEPLRHHIPTITTQPQTRATIFLRRMLSTLFDYEHMKYREP